MTSLYDDTLNWITLNKIRDSISGANFLNYSAMMSANLHYDHDKLTV